MNLNRVIFWLLVSLSLSTPVFAQQATRADIEILSAKLSSLETTVNKIDQRLTNMETTVNDVDKRLVKLETKVDELDKRLTARIDVLFWAIGSLIGVVLAVIVLPQVLGYFQDKRERENFQKQLADLQQQVQRQQREIEELKSSRIMTSS